MIETPTLTRLSFDHYSKLTKKMRFFKKILKIFLIAASVVFVLLIGVIWYFLSIIHGRDHVSDALLIKSLQSNSQKYTQLITMFREDYPLKVVHPTWIDPKDSISNSRWDEYKGLFKELGLDGGMRAWGGESIWFISTAQGLVTGGSSKGYVYKPLNPFPQYQSLDKFPGDLKSNVVAYKKINDSWYITLEWDD